MKITDKGLERILSLGLMKPTSSAGVYFLYSWKSVNYYCGLAEHEQNLKEPGIYIRLTEQQFEGLPIPDLKASNDPKIKQLCEYFQTVAFLKYNLV